MRFAFLQIGNSLAKVMLTEMDTITTTLRKAYYSSTISSQQVTRKYKMSSKHVVSIRSSDCTWGYSTIERRENKKSVETMVSTLFQFQTAMTYNSLRTTISAEGCSLPPSGSME